MQKPNHGVTRGFKFAKASLGSHTWANDSTCDHEFASQSLPAFPRAAAVER